VPNPVGPDPAWAPPVYARFTHTHTGRTP